MKLIMTRGLPASGKSTWALKQVEASGGQIKRVNKDDLRAMIDAGKWSKEREAAIVEARNALIMMWLRKGFDVIVDDTNFEDKHMETLRKIAMIYQAEFQMENFYLPVRECIARDAARAKPVGAKVIWNMWQKYVCQPAPEYDPSLPNAVICDIDGTLAHMINRGPFDWHAVGGDTKDTPVSTLVDLLDSKYQIILFSGRDGVCRPETEQWLLANNIYYNELFMREGNDNRKDYLIKTELYRKHIEGKYNVFLVLDDRDQVVDRWRELGLKCLQVAPGAF